MQCMREIHIQNYRSCSDVHVPLGDLTVLVGRNNSGKSSIMRAAQWLLKKSSLVESDFGDPGRPVVVSGTISGLDSHVLGCLEDAHRKRIEPFCKTGRMQIRRTQNEPGSPAKEIILEVRKDDADGEWAPNPTGIDQAIAALFPDPIEIAAMQDVPEDVAKFKTGSTIGRLLEPLIESICTAHGNDLVSAFEAFNSRLSATGTSRAQEATRFDDEASAVLADFFPGLSLLLDISMPELHELFKRATIKVREKEDSTVRSLTDLGHGAQRAIQMALVQHLASKKIANVASQRTLLLVEEPELYLHPQAAELVRCALQKLSQESYQVIYSTHSPLMVHRDHVADAIVVQKQERGATTVRLPMREAVNGAVTTDGASQAQVLFEFGRASEILFSDRVLLAEGATERRLLPALFEVVREQSHVAAGIGFVSIDGSGNIAKALEILRSMGLDARALVDLDYAFTEAVKAGLIRSDDTNLSKAKRIFGELSCAGKCELSESGLPKSSALGSAADAYGLLAGTSEGQSVVGGVHTKLEQHGIWAWQRGTIEAHLGLGGKRESDHREFEQRLRSGTASDVIADYDGVVAFLDWLVPEPKEQV